jgi:hypothetical protein
MLFIEYQSKDIGSPFRLMTYEILGEKTELGQKQRNAPVWSIVGQYSSSHVERLNLHDREMTPA